MRRKIKRRLHTLRTMWKNRQQLAAVVGSHLFFLENRDVTVWGGISEDDERGIREAVARAAPHNGPIVEIGALFGWTTQLIASLKSPEKELIAVDNFCWNPFGIPPDDHRVVTQRTLHYCLEHCRTRIFDGTARAFYDSYQGPTPSMVFIDADHSYAATRDDIAWACDRGVPVIAGHDYQSKLHQAVVRAVDERFFGHFDLFGSVWIAEGRGAQPRAALAA
ncbi:MAG: class I SAM-dependent methyltransferase [Pirellulales bacterium]